MSEPELHWRKSQRSNPDEDCVEVARAADGTIGVRDSKAQGTGPILEFTPTEWASFIATQREGTT